MTGTFDVVVAGAGHNSLVAAAYLARAGLRCVVLEAGADIGGDTSSAELTVPGFRHDSCSTAHNLIQGGPIIRDDELDLAAHGLEYLHPDPVAHVPFPDGGWLTMWRDEDRTAAEFARFSARDAAAYRRMMAEYAVVAPVLTRRRYTPAARGEPLSRALAGQPGGAAWLRADAMSAWDVIREQFEDDHVRAFMLWMSFMTMQPPDRPGTGLLAYSLAYGRQRHSWTLPRGGSAALPRALARVIEGHGGVIVTGARVTALVLARGRCAGVETAAGERYLAARAVLSTIHVKHLIKMAPERAWGADFLAGARTWRPGISMFVTHYAVRRAPCFPAGGGAVQPVAAGTPQSAARMLRLATDFFAGRIADDDPVLLVLCPTAADPSRAPDGQHTLKVVGFQPYELPDGPARWDDRKDEVAAANLAQLRRYAPGLTDDVILGSSVHSPLDLERMNSHNWHGSCHGGETGSPGRAGYRMPIPGLYQTGATTYPGGSVSGAPGRNAAAVMLADLGSSLDAAVAARR
jgi:phytoene dehydrogenase-like protein